MGSSEETVTCEWIHTVSHGSLVSHCSLEDFGLGLHMLYRDLWNPTEWDRVNHTHRKASRSSLLFIFF